MRDLLVIVRSQDKKPSDNKIENPNRITNNPKVIKNFSPKKSSNSSADNSTKRTMV